MSPPPLLLFLSLRCLLFVPQQWLFQLLGRPGHFYPLLVMEVMPHYLLGLLLEYLDVVAILAIRR